MAFYTDKNGNVVESDDIKNQGKQIVTSHGVLSFAKIFGYMGIALLITAGVAFGLGALFASIWGSGYQNVNQSSFGAYMAVMIISAIGILVCSIVVNVVAVKGRHSVLVPGLLYTIFMGALLSAFTLFIDWRILGLAFGITAGTFLIMTLIAVLSKGNLSGLGIAGFGLLIGAGILALFNWWMMFLLPSVWNTLYWIITFAVFAAMLLITIFDIWRIKKICEKGEMTKNLELYCAFDLYVDFMYIFIRIVYFLIIIFGNKK